MTICYFCNKKIDDIPYRSTFCGMVFCSSHRIPENHDCPFDLRKSSEIERILNDFEVLYQDALDFISKDLTVAKIYEFVTIDAIHRVPGLLIPNNSTCSTRAVRMKILPFRKQ